MDDTEVSSMIVKNSKASNSYCDVAERRWLLPPISDKQQKRPISTLTTDHKTCMITGISRKYPICPIFSMSFAKIGHMEYPNLPERKLIDFPANSRASWGTCKFIIQ